MTSITGHSSLKRLRSAAVRTLASLLLLAPAGCSSEPAHDDDGGGEGSSSTLESRPGDSLFDRLSQATLLAYPESNLPPTIAARVSGAFQMTAAIPAESWIELTDPIPEEFTSRLRPSDAARYWFARPEPSVATSTTPPVVIHDSRPVQWPPGAPFPGLHAWYRTDAQKVLALSAKKPSDVRLLFTADPRVALGEHEPSFAGLVAPYEPAKLMRRVELDRISRPGLLLSAPGALSVPAGRLTADELVFAVAVADQSYRLENDVIERATKGSDGVEFSLEVQSGTKSTTVWKRQVSRDELGRWIEGTADLRAHRGREVTLILRTRPGARGDSAFDYAFWSGLRFRGRAARSPAHPHVVLLDIDTLRADRVSSYRYRRQTTPRLDRWIREHGVVYLDALAASSWTLPSTASMLTGLAPPQHLVRSMESKLGVDTPSLATYLRAAGYETYSFVANSPFFRNGYGFDQGFDVNDSTESIKRWADPLEIIRERRSERPLYVFLHTYMVHAPYKFDRRFLDDTKDRGRSRFEGETITYPDCISAYSAGKLDLSEADKHYINALYDAGVARMDDVAGSFLEQLEEALDGQPALVFVTADHGEEFWEHQGMSHGQSLHHELLRVPLLVRFPEPRADRVSREPVTLLDIVPTVLDYVGMEPSAVLPGASLRRPIPQRRVRVAEAGEGHYALQIGVWKLIRGAYKTPRWKPDPLQLFNLAEDPGELINKAATEPDRVADLERLWTEFLSNHRFESKAQPSEGLGAEDVESLRALGYIQ